jgi:hypothetical protein
VDFAVGYRVAEEFQRLGNLRMVVGPQPDDTSLPSGQTTNLNQIYQDQPR